MNTRPVATRVPYQFQREVEMVAPRGDLHDLDTLRWVYFCPTVPWSFSPRYRMFVEWKRG